MESQSHKSQSSLDVSTQPIKIYEKTYYLPVLNSSGFTQLQKNIKARQELIRSNQREIKKTSSERVFFWIKTEKEIVENRDITFQEKFQELERLVTDYNTIINFLSQHKTSYERFFIELTQELKGIVHQKCRDLANVEQQRLSQEAEDKTDPVLFNLYQSQKQQIFNNVFILYRVTQLMLKKIQLINDSIQKLASDQVDQRQLLENMLSRLKKYQKAYELQKKIDKIEQDITKLAEIAQNFEKIMSPVLGPFQGLIDQVVGIDEELSATVEEIRLLVGDLFQTDVRLSSWDKQGNLGDELLDFLVKGYQKQEYIKDGLDAAYFQSIDSLDQLSLPPKVLENTSLTTRLQSIEADVNTQLNQMISQYQVEINQASDYSDVTNISISVTKSERGIDYTKLEQLLANSNWREADQETGRLMLAIMGRESQGFLDLDDCKNFPASELKIIDQLWVKYSKRHFGFSVQKRIWIECGGGTSGKIEVDVIKKFAYRIGWRNRQSWLSYSELTFDKSSPQAHLPSHLFGGWVWCGGFIISGGGGISFLFSKL